MISWRPDSQAWKACKSVPKSIRDLNALPSSTLRWLYSLMPEPTKFEILWARAPTRRAYPGRARPVYSYSPSASATPDDIGSRGRRRSQQRSSATRADNARANSRWHRHATATSERPCTRYRGPLRRLDRALFPEIECIMRDGHKSVHAAALELASAGKVQGSGTPESRAKRLAMRFGNERCPTATR